MGEQIPGSIIRLGVNDLSREVFVIRDGVIGDGLSENQVALLLQELSHRGFMPHVEPIDAQLQLKLLRQARASSTSIPGRSSLALE